MTLRVTLPLLGIGLLAFAACKKDDDDDPAPATPVVCGIDGMRLQGMIGSDAFCANTSLFADLAILLTANGIQSNGATLTMELDSVDVGTYAMSQDINHVLYTDQLGLAWQTNDGSPATLTITSHDTGSNRIKGAVNGNLFSPVGGASRDISVNFDLTYTE